MKELKKLKYLFSVLIILLCSCSVLKHKEVVKQNIETTNHNIDTTKNNVVKSGSSLVLNENKIITIHTRDTIIKVDSLYFRTTVTEYVETEGKTIEKHDTIYKEAQQKGIINDSTRKEKDNTTITDKKTTYSFTWLDLGLIIFSLSVIIIAIYLFIKGKIKF